VHRPAEETCRQSSRTTPTMNLYPQHSSAVPPGHTHPQPTPRTHASTQEPHT
jgi:hypothetical protein